MHTVMRKYCSLKLFENNRSVPVIISIMNKASDSPVYRLVALKYNISSLKYENCVFAIRKKI